MKKIRLLIIYFSLFVICAIVLYPVMLVVILPFQDADELVRTLSPLNEFTGKYVQIDYIAQYPTLNHFKQLLVYTPEFYRVFWNSLYMTGTILLFQLLIAVPSAWAFAKLRFKWKTVLFNIYVIIMLMPFQITMLSQYLVLNKMDLINTRAAVILPAVFSTFPVFLIYRGFSDIPDDVADSARIDGAGELQVLWNIGIPLGRSGILSCIVLSFLDLWNMVEQPLAFIKDKKLFPLSLYLPMLDAVNSEKMLAASVITLIPAAFIFIIGQDYLEKGIIASALKE
ncbi:MAG: carbohydrate ABC transporter permease [Oscillospiraceae bacterium]|nr:carbohydrate ABC transporter permease [Oscillospiraceae bacterium]